MCKCCQSCLETLYWHLIEKRFCYDESIALYEVPEKNEKNNNMFDNMAFYDSVSVIAGRAIVTIDPLPEEKPIVQQPTRKLRWQEELRNDVNKKFISKSVPIIYEETGREEKEEKTSEISSNEKNNKSENNIESTDKKENYHLEPPDMGPKLPHKSLRERRMSKSLYLKIDQPKELPLIRQQSMPKFYLDTPEDNQTATTSMFRVPSATLTSPVPSKSNGFIFDLYSVVQMERARVKNISNQVPVHKEGDKASRLLLIKEKIKLIRTKSNLGTITNLPHSHHM